MNVMGESRWRESGDSLWSRREASYHFSEVVKIKDKELDAFLMGEFLGLPLGRVQVRKKTPPKRTVFFLSKESKLMVMGHSQASVYPRRFAPIS